MTARPYIGITGVENSIQVKNLVNVYNSFVNQSNISHLLMIGGIVSYKTLIEIKDDPILLMEDDYISIFESLKHTDSKNVLFTLHYFTKPFNEMRPELRTLAQHMLSERLDAQILDLIGVLYDEFESSSPPFRFGIQINVKWPYPAYVEDIKSTFPRLVTILQVPDYNLLKDRISDYNVDYILLDTSHGEGKELDINESIKAYKIINGNSLARIGFAGGFSPENVERKISDLVRKLKRVDFCVDAQSKLRSAGFFDLEKAEKYLRESLEAFKNNNSLAQSYLPLIYMDSLGGLDRF